MNFKQKRLLIVAAGVIGSLYALRFAHSGLDITLLARGKRLDSLKTDGLQYNDNGTIQQISIKTIEKLAGDGMVDIETARSESTLSKVAADIKQNIHLVAQAGIPVIPPETKLMGELPEEDIISRYRQMLSDDFIIDVKLGNQAVSKKAEIMLLDEDFHKKLSRACTQTVQLVKI
ncbi:hypothetical protein J7E73_00030 [Paenibacillus albidus]|uniref:ketopantoate reductase family protein n=1 Tax=Paenibacillus albidus TaxID=2041023 RepID=UPI001BEB4046|nr:2-dehydropantoate 2-reductase N-terminal domain-containing protein [Paenibacillus albidus]MBT2287543.1 hypothetical protein [Paenibacillus albidus]